jgi:hypothetical protein
MIDKKLHIKELYDLKHWKDDEVKGYNYEDNLLLNLTSSIMWEKPDMQEFLGFCQEGNLWMLESTLLLRNLYDVAVDKFYNKHVN